MLSDEEIDHWHDRWSLEPALTVRQALRLAMEEAYAAGQQFAATNMKVRIPTATMEQEFQSHYRRGYAAGQRDEREACAVACCERAKMLEKFSYRAAAEGCAELIRARGEKP